METTQLKRSGADAGCSPDMAHSPWRLFPANGEASELTIECERNHFSASAIARAVEDCDAHLLNMNVTSASGSTPTSVVVDLRVSHRNTASVARSLERYGFTVTGADNDSEDPLTVLARRRALELLQYIDP